MISKMKLITWIIAIALIIVSIIPVRIAIASYKQPVPQAIFVLVEICRYQVISKSHWEKVGYDYQTSRSISSKRVIFSFR